jgi:GGDEF domain-containing protein
MLNVRDVAWALLLPAATLSLAWWLSFRLEDLPASWQVILHYLPYAVMALAVLLSLGFNQARLLFGLLLVTIVLMMLQGDMLFPSEVILGVDLTQLVQGTVENVIGILLPLALLALLLLPERGLMTLAGLWRWLLVIAWPLLVILLSQDVDWLPRGWLDASLLPDSLWPNSGLSDWVVISYLLALLAMLARLVWYRGVTEIGFIGLLAGTALALEVYPDEPGLQLMIIAAGLVSLVALLRNSVHLAYRDELTLLPARRALREQMLKLGRSYAIAMVDVDHFKKFNDRYGHDVGDQVLKMVAGMLAGAGGGSKAFRYGGEEFTLLFAGKDCEQALPVLDLLRRDIAAKGFVIRTRGRPQHKPKPGSRKARRLAAKMRQRVRINVSIGVADSSSDADIAPDTVLKAADKALYRAKKQGRNRVCQ